jgi:PAS domain-containing protein
MRTRSIETGGSTAEHRCRGADGVYRWFQFAAASAKRGGRDNCVVSALTDIEDRKKAEVLRSNERNLTLIINTIP